MSRLVPLVGLVAMLAACSGLQGEPPPRTFMQGGVWFPAATGYWFHQYAERDEIERLLRDLDFSCAEVTVANETGLRCERGFRLPGGVFSRADYVHFVFRRNGAVASAESGCHYVFFDSPALSGTCARYAAKGAVYPSIESFTAMTAAMLRPAPRHQPISVFRMTRGASAPLQDASAAVDQLVRWRFECEAPRSRYTSGFRGNTGEILELRCHQWSLRTLEGTPQSQQVLIRYDTIDLAVLGVTAKLDGTAAALSPVFNTLRDAGAPSSGRDRASGAPSSLTLDTVNGERFEMPWSAVGTGSRQATRDGFATLTPESQRVLVQAYLDKQSAQWSGRLDRLSQANLLVLDWYGPGALPHLDALASDDRPELGAAIVKYRCFAANLRNGVPVDAEVLAKTLAACVDDKRATMPQSIATIDQLLAEDLRVLASSDARALNAFLDFKRDVLYVYALGPDGKESAAALEATVAGKDGLDPGLSSLVSAALAQRNLPLKVR